MAELKAPARSHLLRVFQALANYGWKLEVAPQGTTLARNGQRVVLRSGADERKFRLFVYKVTGSGRNKPYERRIEITSTYQKTLRPLRGVPDVVLGIDTEMQLFVGVDSRRLAHGGPTGNASSFFDKVGLSSKPRDGIVVRQRRARLFPGGIEFHAFVTPARLAEYLLNYETIHAGTYGGGSYYSGRSSQTKGSLNTETARDETAVLVGPAITRGQRRVRRAIIEAVETGNGKALRRGRITPQEFQEILRYMDENGRLGEEFVLNYERRVLRRAGRRDLADRVRWISQESVAEGYDILSYEPNGTEKWIEVKSTVGLTRVFEMTDYEWRTCCAAGKKYYIYRVTAVRAATPSIEKIRDPRRLEEEGLVVKSANGWRVTLI